MSVTLADLIIDLTDNSDAAYGNPDLTPEMVEMLGELETILANPVVDAAWCDAIANVQPTVDELGPKRANPWVAAEPEHLVAYFAQWFTFLATPSGGGLGKIVPFTFFYLNNPSAFHFLNELESQTGAATEPTKEIFDWTVRFVKVRGDFMDSPASTTYIDEWIKSLGNTRKDYIEPPGGYTSFNEFFTRSLNYSVNPRPINEPDDPSILTASADSEINFIQTELTLESALPVKGRQINVRDLLADSTYAQHFVGGTAVSCVLMPNNYHRYHAPVTGSIVESQEVPGIYNGILDGEHWFNQGNIGEGTTEFSIFEDFHRSYFIFETADHGYVGMVPVGLNTISRMYPSMVNDQSTLVPPGATPVPITKGTEIGHFAYGGSLNILLFEPGVLASINVLMGQRLGALGTPTPTADR